MRQEFSVHANFDNTPRPHRLRKHQSDFTLPKTHHSRAAGVGEGVWPARGSANDMHLIRKGAGLIVEANVNKVNESHYAVKQAVKV